MAVRDTGSEAVRRRIMERVETVLEEMLRQGGIPGTIDDIEDVALRLREKAGEITAEELSEAAAEAAEPKCSESHTQACSCGRRARYKKEIRRTLVTMAGTVTLKRSYFYCRKCDQGFCPLDRRLHLPSGAYTHGVQEATAKLCALLPYARASSLLLEYTGVCVCPKEAQRLSEKVGGIVLSARDRVRHLCGRGEKVPALVSSPTVLYLEADGVHTPTLFGYKEAKVGLCRGVDREGKPLNPTQYVATMENAETFGEHWYALAVRSGLEGAKMSVVLGDGAAWIWNLADMHFPYSLQILDVFHATEHLFDAAKAAYPEGDARITAFAEARKAEMLEGRLDVVLLALDALGKEEPQAAEVVRQTRGYIENNRNRMHYPLYRSKGLCIGSGAIESGCKQVVTQRLKGAGMRWTKQGAEAMLALRCRILSHDWTKPLPRLIPILEPTI